MKTLPRLISILIVAITVSLIASCTRAPQWRTATGAVWNTEYHITYCADADLRDSVIAVMKRVEASLSPFAPASLITRINGGERVATDSLLRRVFAESQRVNRLSGGVFDPTVAPLINLWGFGYRNGTGDPDLVAIDSMLRMVGIADCAIDPDGYIERKHPGTEFNFSAITKGYGCDLVGEMLARNGATDYMVEIGGEISMQGHNPRGEKWHIMVDAPVTDPSGPVHEELVTIAVTDCGVATSGNYRNRRETAAGEVWHTISPVTGRPAITDLLSATVIAPTCMTADALATACMAMQAREALAMIASVPGAEALLVTADTVTHTPGFPM